MLHGMYDLFIAFPRIETRGFVIIPLRYEHQVRKSRAPTMKRLPSQRQSPKRCSMKRYCDPLVMHYTGRNHNTGNADNTATPIMKNAQEKHSIIFESFSAGFYTVD